VTEEYQVKTPLRVFYILFILNFVANLASRCHFGPFSRVVGPFESYCIHARHSWSETVLGYLLFQLEMFSVIQVRPNILSFMLCPKTLSVSTNN
jgi:hypothetical protein